MVRSFLVTFQDGTQREYDALSAQMLCNHLQRYFSSFVVEVAL